MYEFTHKGAWFKWGALDKTSKWLCATSLGCAFVGGGLLGRALGLAMNRCEAEKSAHCTISEATLQPLEAIASLIIFLASCVLWYFFSLRQDELFNRVQNYALGVGGTLTVAAAIIWSTLNLANLVPPISFLYLVDFYLVMLIVFWLIAVRKWVS